MKQLQDRILKDGKVKGTSVLMVDSFLNHQVDASLTRQMAEAFHQYFSHKGVNKILTIEASGIAIATFVAEVFQCPMVFAKKNSRQNLPDHVYTSKVESFTHGKVYDVLVAKDFLSPDDRILIIDDFLANGAALRGLISMVEDAHATLVGVGIAIEKAFQSGGETLRQEGIDIYSLARIASMSEETGVVFAPELPTTAKTP